MEPVESVPKLKGPKKVRNPDPLLAPLFTQFGPSPANFSLFIRNKTRKTSDKGPDECLAAAKFNLICEPRGVLEPAETGQSQSQRQIDEFHELVMV